MASREKRPLAPSKTKQKANNDSGLPSPQNNRKRSLPTLRQQQLARDFLEVVATGSQLSTKLEVALPRKKVLRSLRRKQKLRNAKANLIKVKVTKKVPIKNLRRIAVDVKKGVKLKKVKRLVEADRKATKVSEQRGDDTENEAGGKSSKNNLRTKKTKPIPKGTEESESVPSLDRDSVESIVSTNPKSSPKSTRKLKTVETPDSPSKSAKTSKIAVTKRNASKERETSVVKLTRSGGKEVEIAVNPKSSGSSSSSSSNSSSSSSGGSTNASPETKNPKKLSVHNSSVDLTIEEVVASMVSDTETDDSQGVVGGKITRSRKMLIDEKLFTEHEIKKEIVESEDVRSASEEDGPDNLQESQNPIQLRKRSNKSLGQRSLRNGKLRQLSDSVVNVDSEIKKRRWLNMDESNVIESGAESSVDNVSDGNVVAESSFSELSGNENPSNAASSKDETSPVKLESSTDFDQTIESDVELENNNNSERGDRTAGDAGPILRSKTKAKSTETEIKIEDEGAEEPRPLGGGLEGQLDPRKSGSLDQLRKDSLTKLLDKPPKSRRSSLNIDVKKTMRSYYSNEKTENPPKSQIDQMIENIKLTIAKSIESKIFGPEKSLVLNKNFDVPKIEEIIAPLSAESQKLGLDETAEEDKPNVSKNEKASNSSENSVPKVADTAKEIEKLVMGDIELVDTQNSESANAEVSRDEQQVFEPRVSSDNNDESLSRTSQKSDKTGDEVTTEGPTKDLASMDDVETTASDQKDEKKFVITRKSLRIKSSAEGTVNLDNSGKSSGSTDGGEKTKSNVDNESSENCDAEATPSSSVERIEEAIIKSTRIPSAACNDVGVVEESSSISEPIKKMNEPTASVTTDTTTSIVSEDTETLESISKEVERLVSEASSISKVETAAVCTPEKQKITKVEGTQTTEKSMEVGINKESSNLEKMKLSEIQGSLITDETRTPSSLSHDLSATMNSTIEDGETATPIKMHKTNCSTDIQDSNVKSSEKSPVKQNPDVNHDATETRLESGKSRIEKNVEEQKSAIEENRRVLRARDKLKKAETKQTIRGTDANEPTIKVEVDVDNEMDAMEQDSSSEERATPDNRQNRENSDQEIITIKIEEPEPSMRTRRSRDVKKRKEELLQSQNTLKNKRNRRDLRKSDQQNKEETLLDNEVATINENKRSFVDKYGKVVGGPDSLRGFSEGGRGAVDKLQDSADSNRSKSENDIENVKSKSDCSDRLSREGAESDNLKENDNVDVTSDIECKIAKTPEILQKDSDDASTSGESSSSITLNPKIHETPEDKAKKESILRLLGLESLEKAAERLNHQKAKKEQYTGTLKTVIRVQKEKDKEKKRSRSPLKMVLKQGRGDGEGDSPEFYTIQKEFGTSGLGDSSSGANRKFSTNHRHSCDEDNEEAPPKDRQSLVIPEKSSSFSIHPGRLCADVCCYCFGKFGSLDTPMHLAQMKSDERRQKILSVEKHLNKDSCLCDACYRHVDRKANTSPTNMQTKPQRQHRQLMVSKCSARDCREPARHHVKRRWLLKIKAALQNQVGIDWESSQHTSMSFCVDHYSKIERFLTCALCKRRLARNHTHQLATTETEELNQRLVHQGIPVSLVAGTFVCKLCRYFTQLQLKYKDVENMNTNHRSFCKSYRKRILHYNDIEVLDNEDEDASQNTSKDKDKRKKAKCSQTKGAGISKSPDGTTNSASEKSTPEPTMKNIEGVNSETGNDNRGPKMSSNEDVITRDVQQLMDLESTVEKLKKRKALEQHIYPTETSISRDPRTDEVVEILAMDKEVTLTRLPKRPRVSSDITPVVQRLGANPSISVRTLFPGEEEMNLHANIEFANVREVTPQGWEKCATMIQYDRDTKILWQELQRPYGNQSSFLRHLILLEKYYRSGDLVLAPNASRNAINYSTSVQNRLISYEGPEKMDEPIMEPISAEFNSSRRLSGGYVMERDRLSLPSTSSLLSSAASKTNSSTTSSSNVAAQQTSKPSPPRVLKLNSGVSIIKKPPPSLQRLSLPSGSSTNGGSAKRKDTVFPNKIPVTSGGKVFQLSEPEFKRLQNLKRQKQLLSEQQKQSSSPGTGTPSTSPSTNFKLATQYQKAQIAAQTQFQKHLRMQQEMLNRQSRGDFEPLICDVRPLTNENTPTQNLLNNLNLPKSIQVTTKPPNPIPILPKIPKSLTVIPQTVSRPLDK